jgi:hypothetical protein
MSEHNDEISAIIKHLCLARVNGLLDETYDYTNNFDNLIVAKEVDKNKVSDGDE